MRLRSFQGLVPDPARVAEIAAVPYDVVNRQEAYDLAHDKQLNLLHVDRAEIDLPLDVDPYDAAVYEKARENFQQMQADGVLLRETGPVMYLYQQAIDGHSQTGLVAVCHVDDYKDDVIKKHEKTRQDKEDDRTRLVDALSANTGPIFLTYKSHAAIESIIRSVKDDSAPIHDFTAPDGVQHTVWRVGLGMASSLSSFFEESVPCAYIADGHHRAASAYRVATMRRDANPELEGDQDSHWFLSVLFPGNQLRILPYNRAVKDLNGMALEDFLSKVEEQFSLKYTDAKSPTRPGQCCMYLKGQWHLLELKHAPDASPIDQLDVSILQDKLLRPLLGIDDPRTSKRIDFIGGIRGVAELEKLVDSGDHAVAFSMYPVTVEQLMAISDAEQIMPPKSTWFEPKLRSGLFIHTF